MVLVFSDGSDDYTYLGREPFAPSAEALEQYAGFYFSSELQTGWKAVVKEGKLVLEVPRNGDIVLRPVSPDVFGSTGFLVEFRRDRRGAISGIDVSNPRVKLLRFTPSSPR